MSELNVQIFAKKCEISVRKCVISEKLNFLTKKGSILANLKVLHSNSNYLS